MSTPLLAFRARAYAALGDTTRLAIIDLLAATDLPSGAVASQLDIPTNLLAHHLRILEDAELIVRRRSEGDGRRSYLQRTAASYELIGAPATPLPRRVAFVCSANSARSQLAERYWRSISSVPATSAGTHPAARVHPRAVATAHRHGLDLTDATPRLLQETLTEDDLIITVCDRAYEETPNAALHWSVPDPVRHDAADSFEQAFGEIARRVDLLAHHTLS